MKTLKTLKTLGGAALVITLAAGLSFCKKKESKGADKGDDSMKAMQAMKADAPDMKAMAAMKPGMEPAMKPEKKPDLADPKRPAADKPQKLTFAERVKVSIPLTPKPAEQKVGPLAVKAEACKLEGLTPLAPSLADTVKGVYAAKDKVYLLSQRDKKDVLYRYQVAKKSPCVLKIDKTFGTEGVYTTPHSVSKISADKQGRIVLSSIMGVTVLKADGTVGYQCKPSRKGNIAVNPRGSWGLSFFVGSTMQRFEFGPKACKAKPWALQDLGNDKSRKGPLKMVTAVGYYKKLVLVGGVLAKKIDKWHHRVVVAMDAKGKVKFQFGSTKKGFGKDRFGWVHHIGAGKKAPICVVDNNFRSLSIWDAKGKFTGGVNLNKLFGLGLAYTGGYSLAADGAFFWAVSANRMLKKEKTGGNVYEGLVYRVTGL